MLGQSKVSADEPDVLHVEQTQGSDGGLQVLHVEHHSEWTIAELPLDRIRPNRQQPRTVFDEAELSDLAESIRQSGVLQPIVVRPADSDGLHELVMGERRWRASRLAGRATVPAVVRDTDDRVLLLDALVENVQRSDLNPIEEAVAYQQLVDQTGMTQEQVAFQVGRSRAVVNHALGLLRLPEDVQRRVAAGVISRGHAKVLLGLLEEDPSVVRRLSERIVAENLTVRMLEETVALGDYRRDWEGEDPQAPRRRGRSGKTAHEGVASLLEETLDTRVKVTSGKSRGQIVIDFADLDDLQRIAETITGAQAAPQQAAG